MTSAITQPPSRAPVAALPMYDHPAVRAATDALWRAVAERLRARGVPAPEALDRRVGFMEVWTDPGLLLAQTCGYPYATALRDRVRLVATPCYDWPGCEGARYRSWIVVQADDPVQSLVGCEGRTAAVNGPHSQSGHNALRAAIAAVADGRPFLAGAFETGSHAASMHAVAEGAAGLAAIDCVTFGLIARHEPELARRVRVLGPTAAAPGLPLVTAAGTGDATLAHLREVLAEVAAETLLAPVRAELGLVGFQVLDDAAYDAMLEMRGAAEASGQPPLL